MVQRESGIQLHYEKYRKIIQGLTLMSDALMRNVLRDIKCAEYVIRIIMEQADLKIVDVTIQQDNKNLRGRSAVLDCVAEDACGDRYDVEVQQGSGGASPKRARYHSAVLDANTLEPGKDFDTLPKSYVIFITDEDIAGAGLPIYHVAKTVKETKEEFGDQAYIIYVNSKIQDDTELGRLMHDFHCKSPDDMYSRVLAERVRSIKETQEGEDDMCREMEKIYEEGLEKGIEEGRAKGIEEKARETVRNLSAMGLSADKIASAVQVSIEEVREWLSDGAKAVR